MTQRNPLKTKTVYSLSISYKQVSNSTSDIANKPPSYTGNWPPPC